MNGSEDGVPVQKLRALQIIALALLMGVVTFLVVVLVIAQGRQAGDSMIISLISVGMLAVNVLLSLILPGILTQNFMRQIAAGSWPPQRGTASAEYATDGAKLFALRQTTLIIVLALLEGAAFFGCLAYAVEGQAFVLGVVGVAILFMVSNFPTAGGVRAWLDRHLAWLAELRQTQ